MSKPDVHRLPHDCKEAVEARRKAVLQYCCALIAFVVVAVPDCVWAQRNYKLGFMYSPVVLQAVERLQEAYARAGLSVSFKELPHKRSLTFANDGVTDGDVARIAGLESTYPNLRRVTVPVTEFNGAAYVLDSQKIFAYRESLLDSYRVGGILGIVWAEKVMKDRKYEQVKDHEALFNMLLEKRVDIVLASEWSSRQLIASDKKKYGRVRLLKPYVLHLPLYHYVNKENEDIIPLLEAALQEMEKERQALEKP